MNRVQELQFELMREASFNSFDGDHVTASLKDNPTLWRAAVMTRLDDLIYLRDIPDGHWNIDTLYILPAPGKEDQLRKLANDWGADEVDWIGAKEGSKLLGSSVPRNSERVILQVWWD